MAQGSESDRAQERFSAVFTHLGAVTAYARRRGCTDPDALAAEVMAIAWRRLADVPRDDPRPWLFAVARNLAHADWRRRSRDDRPAAIDVDPTVVEDDRGGRLSEELDPALKAALLALSFVDREALLLVAWEELSPTAAAHALGINPVAFRVRLHRARRRCQSLLEHERPRLSPATTTNEPELS